MKKVIYFLITAFASIFIIRQAYAEAPCQVVYGGGEVCPGQIQYAVDKKVQETQGGEYIDNMTSDSLSYYSSSDLVNFKITIKNTSNTKIATIDLTDTLPEFSEFYAGPGNVKTSEGKTTVSFPIKDLESGKSAEFFLTVRILPESNWPENESIVCRKNTVRTVAEGKDVRSDSSQVCFVRRVLGVSKGGVIATSTPKVFPSTKGAVVTPPTGAEVFGLIGLLVMGASGFFLREVKFEKSNKTL